MIVTVFKNIWDTTDPLHLDVLEVFRRIKDGNSQTIVEQVRNAANGDEKQNIKKRLSSICFSGKFSERKSGALLTHSGLICLDIDKLNKEQLGEIKELLSDDPFVFACFVSPGGAGLKLVIKIAPEKAHHKSQFLALEQYFNKQLKKYKAIIDESGKDIGRVCYESYDPDIYYNPDSDLWCATLEEVSEQKEVEDHDVIIKLLQVWINKKENYYEGNRNNFLYQFASAMCRYGISENRCLGYLMQNYSDYPGSEMTATVKGAFKANDFKCATFTDEEKRNKISAVNIEDTRDITSFWVTNDKGKVKIDSKHFLRFIAANGFGIYRQKRSDSKWVFVHIENMIVDVVDVVDIKNYILDYVEKNAPEPVFDELQMKNRYFEKTFLNALPLVEVEQIRDNSDSSFFFFEKFYYEITKEEMKKYGYQDLKGRHIWRSQICKYNITKIVPFKEHDFSRFIFNAMGQNAVKYNSARAALGYLIHTYKKKRLAKLIYACDESSGELDGMAEGGTGKNLMFESLKFVRSVIDVDGKAFDKRDKFGFQMIDNDTQNLAIDDYEGDIKEFFTKVTGHFEVEKKGMDKVSIPFEEAPKIHVSSNSAPQGFSSSFARRLHVLEFSNYYNESHTPSDDFGDKDFFSDDWTQDDWNAFYSFMFRCSQYYLQMGLQKTQITSDTRFKQLVKNTGREFADFFKDMDMDEYMNGRDVYHDYIQSTGDQITIQKFYGNLRKLCSIYGWKLDSGGRGAHKQIKIIK